MSVTYLLNNSSENKDCETYTTEMKEENIRGEIDAAVYSCSNYDKELEGISFQNNDPNFESFDKISSNEMESKSDTLNITDTVEIKYEPEIFLEIECDPVKEETEELWGPDSPKVRNTVVKKQKRKRLIQKFSEEDERSVEALIQYDESGIFLCGSPGCFTKTKLRNTMKRHIRVHHLNLVKYQCEICEYSTKFLQALNAHTSAIHEKISHQCPHCDFTAAYKTNVQKHIKIVHENSSKLQCPFCEFQSAKKFLLDHHIEGMHIKKPLHCDQCSFVTTWKNTFKRHVQRCHKKQEKKVKCELCPYASLYPYEMKSHIYFKHGEGSMLIVKKNESGVYACEHCDYVSQRVGNLKLHIFSKHVSECQESIQKSHEDLLIDSNVDEGLSLN